MGKALVCRFLRLPVMTFRTTHQDLIRNDADLDALDLARWTPLQYAVYK